MVVGYDECRVVFDRYLDQSLKNKTRQKRAAMQIEFEIHPEMKLTMSLKEILSSSKNKSGLTSMFAQGLLKHFANNSACKLVVVFGNKIKGQDFEECHLHEQADTLIPHQVLATIISLVLTGVENLWVLPRRPGLVHTWSLMMMTLPW